jgi:hypothetical protein
MATDYYQMGLGLGGAYFEGKEEARQRDRQIENDKRVKQDYDNRQTSFQQAQADRSALDSAAQDGPTPGGLPPSPIGPAPQAGEGTTGAADMAADSAPAMGKGLPAPAGAPGAEDGAPPAAKGVVKADPKMEALQRAVRFGKANVHNDKGASLMSAQNAVAAHIQGIEDGATATGVLKATPEQLSTLYQHINNHSKTLTAGPILDDKGKDTGYTTLSIVGPDGNATNSRLSRADLAKVAVAQKKLERGDMSGLEDMHNVSKDLATAVASEMGLIEKSATTSNDAQYKKDSIDAKGAATEARLTIAGMRAETAALRLEFAKSGKEMDPKDAAELNDLSSQVDEATSPAEKAKAQGLWKRKYGLVMGKMGKVVNPNEPRDPAQDPGRIATAIKALTEAGMPLAQAQAKADELYGRDDGHAGALADLAAARAKKAGATTGAPTVAAPAGPRGPVFGSPEDTLARRGGAPQGMGLPPLRRPDPEAAARRARAEQYTHGQ